MMKDILLDGQWEFKAIDAYQALPRDKRGAVKWMKAEVPGTVHTDLMRRYLIKDPFSRMNEADVQWVESMKWAYRKRFIVPENFMSEEQIDLDARGLDTYALILVNGKKVAETSNMFIGHRFPVKEFLNVGTNEIEIIFDSPARRAAMLEEEHGPLAAAHDATRLYVRKAQYAFGWDWGPRLVTSGIWRSIRLQAYSHGRLAHPFARVASVSEKEAAVELTVEVQTTAGAHPLTVHAFVGGGMVAHEYDTEIVDGKARFDVRIPEPRLWWPNEYGEQPMYTAVLTLRTSTEDVDAVETSFALRTVKLIQEDDADGRSFIFEVNGRKIFCKGANWIPPDSFIPRVPYSTYERLLSAARDAHMNMIRVWGGGIYEQERFYDLCDRLGLMVWQDFMFACGEYPDGEWFTSQVRDEAVDIVKRLRNHPSIVLWCGNNESEWLFCSANPGKGADEMKGAQIFSSLLPSVCEHEDGTRLYWRSSPFGSGDPNAESDGTHHQWEVWSSWKDYSAYAHNTARFVSEFGFQSPAGRKAFEGVTEPEDRAPQSAVMEHHNKQMEGTARLFRFIAAHERMPASFDEFVYHGQLVQAEALKIAVEHWRRRKFKTAGTLFWQLNDCWPATSWSVIDSALAPKAAYYYAKRFYAPLLFSFKSADRTIELWVTNDATMPIRGNAVIELLSMNGGVRWKRSKPLKCDADSSYAAARVHREAIDAFDPASHYLRVRFETSNGLAAENRLYFREPKHLHLPKAKLKWKLAEEDGVLTLSVSSSKFAKNVRLEMEEGTAEFSDNYFDLDAGEKKHIRITTNETKAWVKKRLRLSSLH